MSEFSMFTYFTLTHMIASHNGGSSQKKSFIFRVEDKQSKRMNFMFVTHYLCTKITSPSYTTYGAKFCLFSRYFFWRTQLKSFFPSDGYIAMETEFLIIRFHVPFFNEKICPPLLRQFMFGFQFSKSIIVPCKKIDRFVHNISWYHIRRHRYKFFLPTNSIQVIIFAVV